MPRRYSGPLSTDEGRHGISLMMKNALRLLDHAQAATNTDPALANFLSLTALEELAKAYIIHKEAIHGTTNDWKPLWRKIRNHKDKVVGALFGDMPDVAGALTLDQIGVTAEQLLGAQKYSRESSLYVDSWEEDGKPFWTVPQRPGSTSITAARRSVAAIRLAYQCLEEDLRCCAQRNVPRSV